MPRAYTISWANGKAFSYFNIGTKIEIDDKKVQENGNYIISIKFIDLNANSDIGQNASYDFTVDSHDNYEHTFPLNDAKFPNQSITLVMTEWYPLPKGTDPWLLGEVFIDDPNGAGGFGGQGGG